MKFKKDGPLKKIIRLMIGVAALICLINAVGCLYMQHQLKLNAEDVMRQILVRHVSAIGQEFAVSAQVFGITGVANLSITDQTSNGNSACASGQLEKSGGFGFIFSIGFGLAQFIQVCE